MPRARKSERLDRPQRQHPELHGLSLLLAVRTDEARSAELRRRYPGLAAVDAGHDPSHQPPEHLAWPACRGGVSEGGWEEQVRRRPSCSQEVRRSSVSGRSGDRTRTEVSLHGILSPVRLPISPSGHLSASPPSSCSRVATRSRERRVHRSRARAASQPGCSQAAAISRIAAEDRAPLRQYPEAKRPVPVKKEDGEVFAPRVTYTQPAPSELNMRMTLRASWFQGRCPWPLQVGPLALQRREIYINSSR